MELENSSTEEAGELEFDSYLFDLDGVIVDVEDSYRRKIFDEVSEVTGRQYTDSQIQRLWHGVGGESREGILESWGENPREFWRIFDWFDAPERRLQHTYVYPDADVLTSLEGPVGVVTHSPRDLAESALEKADLLDVVDEVVACSYETGYKPDPTPIEMCLERVGADPDGAALVGDSESDVQGAWNAGIAGGHVDRIDHPIDADFRVESLRELPALD